MSRFLINTDEVGTIEAIHWCLPEGMLRVGDSLLELFPQEDHAAILAMFRSLDREDPGEVLTTQVRHPESSLAMTLLSLFIGDQIYVLGFGDEHAVEVTKFVRILNDYANQVRQEFKEALTHRQESIQDQFEEIQQLNNELINVRRELTRTNQRLNVRNRELQDRLVEDPLTGLISRYQYWADLEAQITEEPTQMGLFFFIDLDDFKGVNDTYGHAVGDRFLQAFADRLRQLPFPDALRIRLAGDEFALYLHGFDTVDREALRSLWEEIKRTLGEEPVALGDLQLPVSFSVGLAVFNRDTDRISQLIEYADWAMYRAKRKGKNRLHIFSHEEYVEQQTDTRQDHLRRVLEDRRLYHVFQPVVRVSDATVAAYAVYLRTDDPYFEDTEDMLRAAVEAGCYRELDALSFSLIQKFYQRSDSVLQGYPLFLTHGPYPWSYDTWQGRTDSPLVLEVMEYASPDEKEMDAIHRSIQDSGHQLALGWESAGDLMFLALGPDYLKVPRRLIRNLHQDPDRRRALGRVFDLCHRIAIEVVAEGVESAEELRTVVQLGVDYVQGYYVAPPAQVPQDPDPSVHGIIRSALQREENR